MIRRASNANIDAASGNSGDGVAGSAGKQDAASRSVRTRFAPSPTGFMHIGGIRTALFAWAYARNQNGQFILRIEDTDKQREIEGALEHITESLRWLGIEWDEGPDKGELGPYIQSERLEIYQRFARQLIESGLAYADPYSQEEVERFRQQAKEEKRPFLFRNHRPENPPEWDGSLPLRFKISAPKRYEWHDEVRGPLSAGEEALDDFIIIKQDGYPTYNFAHVVDDHEMEVSHVMRGEEFLASVPKFLALHDALDWPYPKFATLPAILSPQGGKKLSKRDGAKDVLDYREEGYLPEAMLNFLASLGWNDGSEQEIFTPEEIVAKFSLERIQKGGARFDKDKLGWMNWQHFKQRLEGADAAETMSQFADINAEEKDAEFLQAAARLSASKSDSVDVFRAQMDIFMKRPTYILGAETLKSIDKQLDSEEAAELLELARSGLEQLDSFDSQAVESALRGIMADKQLQPRLFLNLVRWAVSGQRISPSLFDMLAVLGRMETLERLAAARSYLIKQ